MAKRRRKKPNIPQAAMEHARQEMEQDEQPTKEEAKPSPKADTPKQEKPAKTQPTEEPKPRSRRRNIEAAKLQKRKNADGPLDGEYVAEMLANPTKVVTEEDLKEDYGFVIKDLRNMGILAAVLFICLVGVALVIL